MGYTYDNAGRININAVRDNILSNGGGENVSVKSNGDTHHTLYLDDRRLSYDVRPDGGIENIHSSHNGTSNGNHVNYSKYD